MIPVDNIAAGFVGEAKGDFVGLWEVVHTLTEEFGVHDRRELRRETLLIVAKILGGGLLPGKLAPNGGFNYWPETDPKTILARIEREWDSLGHDPHLVESICWFALPPDQRPKPLRQST